jgi:hypothetical protein
VASTIERLSSELNLKIDKGADFTLTLLYRNGEGDINASTPSQLPPIVDLTGMDVVATVRPNTATDDTEDYILSKANGKITTDDVDGLIKLKIDDADLNGFAWYDATYMVNVTDSTGDIRPVVHGRVKLFDRLGVTS